MPEVSRCALVNYHAAQMYDLVADITTYPDFLPWCRAVVVHEATDILQVVTLEIAKGPIHSSFTTRNTLDYGQSIHLTLERGPLTRLDGIWRFTDLEALGCRVSLTLDFELANAMLSRVVGPLFNTIGSTMVDAFCKRAARIYGGGK